VVVRVGWDRLWLFLFLASQERVRVHHPWRLSERDEATAVATGGRRRCCSTRRPHRARSPLLWRMAAGRAKTCDGGQAGEGVRRRPGGCAATEAGRGR
jgi:hypothetical protein